MDIFISIFSVIAFVGYALLLLWGYECAINGGHHIITYLSNYYKFKKVNNNTQDIQSSVKMFTFGVVIILLCISVPFIAVLGGYIRVR
jgi:hypothetical protein